MTGFSISVVEFMGSVSEAFVSWLLSQSIN
jgi:hypothetical protein